MQLPQSLWKENKSIEKVFLILSGSLEASSSIIRFAGGCVRNWILGKLAVDIDCATILPPEKVIELLEKHNISHISPGLSHGTVTALFKDGSIEITTLREDILTTGRHAKVVFTDSWEEDAQRRDFTMNALFCDWTGQLYDYVGGIEDLQKGILRFVGDPAKRIQEDYLRILRFFRFFAFYAKQPIDPSLLEVLHHFASKLSILSKERIHQEFFKLLQAPFVLETLKAMESIDIFSFICPKISLSPAFKRFLGREILFEDIKGGDALSKKQAFLRFCVLLLPEAETINLSDLRRLSLSKKQQKELFALLAQKKNLLDSAPLSFSRKDLVFFGLDLYKDYLWLKAHLSAYPPTKKELFTLIKKAEETFPDLILPLSGEDLTSIGIAPSPTLGILLKKVKDFWLSTDCTASKERCIAFLENLLR